MYLGPPDGRDTASVIANSALSVSVQQQGSWGASMVPAGRSHRYAAAAAQLVPVASLAGWPGVTCSCDNPLFAADEEAWACADPAC
jgi:hypothetical protein